MKKFILIAGGCFSLLCICVLCCVGTFFAISSAVTEPFTEINAAVTYQLCVDVQNNNIDNLGEYFANDASSQSINTTLELFENLDCEKLSPENSLIDLLSNQTSLSITNSNGELTAEYEIPTENGPYVLYLEYTRGQWLIQSAGFAS